MAEFKRWKNLNSFRIRDRIDFIPRKYLTPTEYTVLSVLARHYPLNYLSEAKLAFFCKLSLSTFRRALRSLIRKGYVKITPRPGRTTVRKSKVS